MGNKYMGPESRNTVAETEQKREIKYDRKVNMRRIKE
jgi:hypothetical protein